MFKIIKNINNVIRGKMSIKNLVLDYIRYKELHLSLGKFWNGAHLEDEGEDLEVRGCRRLQQE